MGLAAVTHRVGSTAPWGCSARALAASAPGGRHGSEVVLGANALPDLDGLTVPSGRSTNAPQDRAEVRRGRLQRLRGARHGTLASTAHPTGTTAPRSRSARVGTMARGGRALVLLSGAAFRPVWFPAGTKKEPNPMDGPGLTRTEGHPYSHRENRAVSLWSE